MRPAHLHFLAVKDGFKTLESRRSMSMTTSFPSRQRRAFRRHPASDLRQLLCGTTNEKGAGALDVEGPWYSLDYTFVMERGRARLPRPPITGKASGERPKIPHLA